MDRYNSFWFIYGLSIGILIGYNIRKKPDIEYN